MENEELIDNAHWYAAQIIQYSEQLEGHQDSYQVWQNIYLMNANSTEQAFDLAVQIGLKEEELDCHSGHTIDGIPASWRFAGVPKLDVISGDIRNEYGCEITYFDYTLLNRHTLDQVLEGHAGQIMVESHVQNLSNSDPDHYAANIFQTPSWSNEKSEAHESPDKIWHAAHVLNYIEFMDGVQDSYPVREYIFLLGAESDEDGFDKADLLGLTENLDSAFQPCLYKDRPARWKYAGLWKLGECILSTPQPEYGDEIAFISYTVQRKESIANIIYMKPEAAALDSLDYFERYPKEQLQVQSKH